jgi:uncharacterized protein YceK
MKVLASNWFSKLALVISTILVLPGCGTIMQISGEGLATFGGVRVDILGIAVGIAGPHPVGILALLDLPLSLVADLILFIPCFLFGGPYIQFL